MVDYSGMYPDIPQTGENPKSGNDFRLHKVNMVLSQLGEELKHYERVRKKYSRLRSLFQGTAVTSGILSAVLTASGIGVSLTGPGLAVGIPLSALGGFCGIVSASCGVIVKRVTKKISKHEMTLQLIKSKDNSINDLVSKALRNNQIDENEFELILSEIDKYSKMKASIRRKKNEQILKNDVPDVQKLREELRKEIVDQLTNPKK